MTDRLIAIRANITGLAVHAIVNSANATLLGGSGDEAELELP